MYLSKLHNKKRHNLVLITSFAIYWFVVKKTKGVKFRLSIRGGCVCDRQFPAQNNGLEGHTRRQ